MLHEETPTALPPDTPQAQARAGVKASNNDAASEL
jgi:hypothetical protein